MSSRRVLGAPVAALVVGVVFVGVGLGPAAAAPSQGTENWSPGVCTDAALITVVIDFHELAPGTAVQVRCAHQDPEIRTGFEALQRAGFEYATTVRFPGFLCKITDPTSGRALPSDDPCQTASPAAAYWSYWHTPQTGKGATCALTVPPAGDWSYSQFGAGNRKPCAGSTEAWSFSKDKTADTSPPPRLALPGLRPAATVPPTAPAASPPGDGGDPGERVDDDERGDAGPGPTAPGGSVPPADGAMSADASTTTSGPIAETGAVSSTTARGSGGDDRAAAADEPLNLRASDDGAGSPAGVLVGGGVVSALAALAVVSMRRRRAATEPDG